MKMKVEKGADKGIPLPSREKDSWKIRRCFG